MNASQDRRSEAIAATMARAARHRGGSFQRVEVDDLRDSVRTIVNAFLDALSTGEEGRLYRALDSLITKRLSQGVHPLEIYGLWHDFRWIVDLNLADQSKLGRQLLERSDGHVTQLLRRNASLSQPRPWPSMEIDSLGRTVDRVRVSLELLGGMAPDHVARSTVALTRREREILTLSASGLTVDKAAKAMRVSPATARTYLARAIAKLGAVNRMHAVALAVRHGIAVPSSDPQGSGG
jgi:DNA-binding CsgD family transcriptional regulator